MKQPSLSELIRESATSAVGIVVAAMKEAAGATGEMRGAPQASGKFPPSAAVEDGGQKKTPTDPGSAGTAATAEMRGAPQSAGVGAFSTGGPAPMGDIEDPSGSHHVSDDTRTVSMPGTSEHVSEAALPGLPCATCSHFKGHHILEADMCMWCGPKGSTHRFTEKLDLTPQLMTVPLHSGSAHDTGDVVLGLGRRTQEATTTSFVGTLREGHMRLFTNEEQALIRLTETINSWSYGKNGEAAGGAKEVDATKSKGNLYNAHTMAAHKASMMAFQGSTPEHHEVAAAHHTGAADAATAAASTWPDGSQAKSDYNTAASYHKKQADAHTAAAKTASRGNTHSRYEMGSNNPWASNY